MCGSPQLTNTSVHLLTGNWLIHWELWLAAMENGAKEQNCISQYLYFTNIFLYVRFSVQHIKISILNSKPGVQLALSLTLANESS